MPKIVPIKLVIYGKYRDKELLWVAKNDLEFFKQIETLYYPRYNTKKQKYYKSLKKRFVENDGLVTIHRFENEIHETVDLMRQRLTSEQIREELKKRYPKILSNHEQIISDAITLIRKEFDQERDYLIDVHMVRYEKLYQENFLPNLDYVPPAYKKAVMCEHLLTAMETLFQKEKLLGVHTKNFKLRVSKTVLKRSDTDFDFTRVTAVERLELLSFLNKSRATVDLIRPIVNENPLDIDTSKHLPEEEKIESPVKKVEQTDKKRDEMNLVVTSTSKSLVEVGDIMKKTLEERVRELFEKKNKK